MYQEPTFPRGGKIVKPKKDKEEEPKQKKKTKVVQYGVRTDKTEKKVKPSKKQRDIKRKKAAEEQAEELTLKSADPLTSTTLVDGMLLLGIIKSINEADIEVSLPGKLIGRVALTEISDPYSKLLLKAVEGDEKNIQPMTKLFKPGQNVCVVVSKKDGEKKFELSLNPTKINKDRKNSSLQKGMIICGAVTALEEQGYAIDTGIKNLRAFLPMNKTKTQYFLGSVVYATIDDLSKSGSLISVVLKTKKDFGTLELENKPKLENILPGSIVPFTPEKILKNGLVGKIFDTYTSFVNENYLTEPLHRASDYTIGLEFEARVMYVTPNSNYVGLTLNFSKVQLQGDDGILPIGHLVKEAVSLGRGTGGVLFKLNKSSKGVLSFNKIKTNLKEKFDPLKILHKYGKNSKHAVRVVRYDIFERVYICTDQERALNEPYFSVNDFKVGDDVEAKITLEFNGTKGYGVKVGRVRGYINGHYTANGTLEKGTFIKARVLEVDRVNNLILLTNRTEFLKTKAVLASFNQAVVNQIYTGLIFKDVKDLFLIKFFGGVIGVLYKNNTGVSDGAATYLREGVITNFRIAFITQDRLILRVATDLDRTENLGKIVKAKIECMFPTGAQVKVKKLNITGTIPLDYFSDYLPLAQRVLDSMREGQKITVVNVMNQIFSLRDVDYYEQDPPLTFDQVEVGHIMKGFVRTYENNVLEIICPLRDYKLPVKLHINKILPNSLPKMEEIEIQPNQVIYLRVEAKNIESKQLFFSAKLSDVWNGSPDASVSLMQKYFHDLDTIRSAMEVREHSITNYKVGQIVTATIKEYFTAHHVLILELPGSVACTSRNVTTFNYKLGDQVEGRVVWIDYARSVVDMTINPHAIKMINENQVANQSCLGEKRKYKGHVTLVRDDIIIVSVLDKPLIHIAPRFHMNDFQPTMIANLSNYGKCCVELLDVVEGRLMGMFEENFKQCQNFQKIYTEKYGNVVKEAKKRKLSESSQEDGDVDITEVTKIESDEPPEKKKKKKHLKQAKVAADSVELTTSPSSEPTVKVNKQKNKAKKNTNGPEPKPEMNGKKKFQKKTVSPNKQGKKKKQKGKTTESNLKTMFQNQLDGTFDKLKGQTLKNKHNKRHDGASKKIKEETFTSKKEKKPNTTNPKQKKLSLIFKPKKAPKPDKLQKKRILQAQREIKVQESIVKNKKLLEVKTVVQPKAEKKEKSKSVAPVTLPSAENFWNPKRQTDTQILDELLGNSTDQNTTKPVQKFNKNNMPSTAIDYDRLLAQKPDNGSLWVKYMQFHMQSFEINQAKLVGQRALKVIGYRMESEKLKVWNELIRIEIQHGNNDTFNETFKEAITCNQPLKIYAEAIKNLIAAEKLAQVNGLMGTLVKKFKPFMQMWEIAAETYYMIGEPNKAKEVLDKAFKSLKKDEHTTFTRKFALLSNRYDQKEYAQSIYENLLTLHPNRIDIWFEYVDMLVKDNLIDFARIALDRAIVYPLPARRIKSLYKKYLEVEEKYGTPDRVKELKKQAAKYVETVTEDTKGPKQSNKKRMEEMKDSNDDLSD